MGLVPVELATPRELRGRWAALAAVLTARGWSDSCRADGRVWHYDDSGGNWCELHHVGDAESGDDRAVLIGHDHEYSDTYYANAAAYFQEDETDILAGAPDWWAPPVRAFIAGGEGHWVGFAYGFDGTAWARAEYDPDDGFRSVGLPAVSDAATRERIVSIVQHAGVQAPTSAVDALVACDGAVDPEHVAAVAGPLAWDAAAGAAAARAFLG